jgi:hypothetical protein
MYANLLGAVLAAVVWFWQKKRKAGKVGEMLTSGTV